MADPLASVTTRTHTRRMARRPIKEGRSARIELRVSPEELAAIQAAADRDERTATDWARRAILRAVDGAKPRETRHSVKIDTGC